MKVQVHRTEGTKMDLTGAQRFQIIYGPVWIFVKFDVLVALCMTMLKMLFQTQSEATG